MNQPFGVVYADAYDLIYRDKDYNAECDLLERIFQKYGNTIHSVLDLGCGTGNHAFPLAQRGYEVVGIDRSADMLAHARKKSANAGTNARIAFQQADIRMTDLSRNFDAALMMFAVLGYQHENADVLSALRTARRHLCSGGIFIFDVWYGPAVLHERPSQRIKVIPGEEGEQILRVTSGELDTRRQLCNVYYHIWRLREGKLTGEAEERHSVRYFFSLELDLLLECAGFAPIRLGAFPHLDQEPGETTWNVLVVARAV
jgi:SAM-dependent methyltransferase